MGFDLIRNSWGQIHPTSQRRGSLTSGAEGGRTNRGGCSSWFTVTPNFPSFQPVPRGDPQHLTANKHLLSGLLASSSSHCGPNHLPKINIWGKKEESVPCRTLFNACMRKPRLLFVRKGPSWTDPMSSVLLLLLAPAPEAPDYPTQPHAPWFFPTLFPDALFTSSYLPSEIPSHFLHTLASHCQLTCLSLCANSCKIYISSPSFCPELQTHIQLSPFQILICPIGLSTTNSAPPSPKAVLPWVPLLENGTLFQTVAWA